MGTDHQRCTLSCIGIVTKLNTIITKLNTIITKLNTIITKLNSIITKLNSISIITRIVAPPLGPGLSLHSSLPKDLLRHVV
jgi:hypothetical protein